jgi:hypothetical protein
MVLADFIAKAAFTLQWNRCFTVVLGRYLRPSANHQHLKSPHISYQAGALAASVSKQKTALGPELVVGHIKLHCTGLGTDMETARRCFQLLEVRQEGWLLL